MATEKITKRTIDKASAGERDAFIWDTETAGFGLKVTPAGRKVYVLQYRFRGQLRRFTIGRHGSPWTPDQAREEAKRLLMQMAAGNDPAHEKRRLRDDPTIANLCELYLSEGRETVKPATVEFDRRTIEHHVKPLLGSRKAGSITRADIERARRDVAAGKTARDGKFGFRRRVIVKGGKSIANRMVDTLAGMFAFAEKRGLRRDNPARGIKDYPIAKRERFLSIAEIGRLGDELAASGRRGANPYPIAALRLLLLTGCRKSEILNLKWSDVDWDGHRFNLRDSKTGPKSVQVGAPVLALLSALPRIEGNDYVLPGGKAGHHYVGLQKQWELLRKRCGLENVRLHDKRHSFASMGVASGETLFIVGKVLGHANATMTERYAHLADDPLRAAADRISGRIADSLNQSAPSAEVVEMRKGRRE